MSQSELQLQFPIVNESAFGNWQSAMDALDYAYMPRIFVTVATRLMATM